MTRRAIRLLSRDGPPIAVPRLVALLRACACWCPDELDIDAVLALAARPALEAVRDALLGHVVEPLLARAPERVTESTLERIQALFGGCARHPYTLALLGARPGTPLPVRDRIAGLTAGMFPARDAAHTVLARSPLAFLVVLNVRVGQGDEIVWLAALLQALLDANPTLHCTVVTRRAHLYDHPRVRAVPILDDGALDATLALRYDGVMHVSEPGWPDVAWHPSLDARVHALLADQQPALVITGTVGHNHFVYPSVALDGRDIAVARSLDRLGAENIYDGCQRLLAELGLPTRVAEERPAAPDPLTGSPSADAGRSGKRLWAVSRGRSRW